MSWWNPFTWGRDDCYTGPTQTHDSSRPDYVCPAGVCSPSRNGILTQRYNDLEEVPQYGRVVVAKTDFWGRQTVKEIDAGEVAEFPGWEVLRKEIEAERAGRFDKEADRRELERVHQRVVEHISGKRVDEIERRITQPEKVETDFYGRPKR